MTPTAKMISRSGVSTSWEIRFPSSLTKQGATYFAKTYPGSDLIYVETVVNRRRVSASVGRKLIPAIRQAIAHSA